MRSVIQIEELLPELEYYIADELEDQDLDFKQWDTNSMNKSIDLVVKMAVCMANGGGGTTVFGIADRIKGRENAILGVPREVDVNLLKRAVYDKTDPKITPVFEECYVAEGTGRLLLMQIYSGLPPYTDTSGKGTVRIGTDCQPLTGTMRKKISIETGETDFSSELLDLNIQESISASALEIIRDLAKKEKAPDELLRLSDSELLDNIGLIKNSKLTKAGLIIAGNKAALHNQFTGYAWTYLKMQDDTNYSNRVDDHTALPVAVARLEELITAYNPIVTVEYGLFHFEYRKYPQIALREALLNAFCHCDYRLNAPIVIKQYDDHIEISNPGSFIGGITPSNILHHQPVPRNPLLVDALLKLRLVNRSSLGISRMYKALLVEGKEPPLINENGESVNITFLNRDFSPAFRAFVEANAQKDIFFKVDDLIIFQYLLHHTESDTNTLAALCQRNESQTRDLLNIMEQNQFIERGGSGRGTYWVLRPEVRKQLALPGHPERDRRIDWEAAKTRILSILIERTRKNQSGLSNKEIRQLTHYNRNQVTRLLNELRKAHKEVQSSGHGAGARYFWSQNSDL